ncbi:MAG: transposase [Oligoflexales bacterium]
MPIRSLALYCRKNNLLSCNVETWYKYSKKNNWVRPKPERLKHEKLIGLRAKEPNEVWHMDITHLKTTVGKTYYLQVIIDNYSRFVVGWKIASAANALESAELLKKSKLVHYKNVHLVTDGGPENDNRLIRDTLVTLKSRLSLARHDICSSNSLVESFFRSLKNNYLYGQKCKTFKSLKSKVGFYIRQHNEIMPHNAFHSATPQEVFKDPQLATEKSFKGVAMKDVMQERIFCNTLVRCQSCS